LKVGAPFNPYRVFQGSFAPYWLLQHRGISAGAKLCYVRLLGFPGRDARCYPSLETLGASLGVSERQARDYVKELERSGFIAVEQRGLRKTNAYLFVWTAELERLVNAVPESGEELDESDGGPPQGSLPDRNNGSGPDRKHGSAPDRNSSSGPDRNSRSGLTGINSLGISSLESSSSSNATAVASRTKTTTQDRSTQVKFAVAIERPNELAETISRWAKERGVRRLRSDRRVGYPDEEHLVLWSGILEQRGFAEPGNIFAVLDAAVTAATRSGEWRHWAFLTLQVQLAAERLMSVSPDAAACTTPSWDVPEEDPSSDWALAKQRIRNQIGVAPFLNWFERTRQVERRGGRITIAVPDEPSRFFVEVEYGTVTRAVLAELGIEETEWTVRCRELKGLELEPGGDTNERA
jgi:hypothetical protein